MSEELLTTTPPTPYDYGLGGLWVSQSEKDLYDGLPVANGLPDSIRLENGRVYYRNEVNRYVWEGEPDFQFDLIFWDYPEYYTFLLCANELSINRILFLYGFNNPDTHGYDAAGSKEVVLSPGYSIPYGTWTVSTVPDEQYHQQDLSANITSVYLPTAQHMEYIDWGFQVELESGVDTPSTFKSFNHYVTASALTLTVNVIAIPRTECRLHINIGTLEVYDDIIGYIYPSTDKAAGWTVTIPKDYTLRLTSNAFAGAGQAGTSSIYQKDIQLSYKITSAYSAFPVNYTYPDNMYFGYVGDTTITLQKGFTIQLWERINDALHFAQVTGNPFTVTGVLSEYTDVVHPKITIVFEDPTTEPAQYNFVSGLFNRYYNVTNIKQVGQDVWEYSLEVDVITTYYRWIMLNGSGYIERGCRTGGVATQNSLIDPLKYTITPYKKMITGRLNSNINMDYYVFLRRNVSALTGTRGDIVVTGLRVGSSDNTE